MTEPCFNELRTQQQLAYSVSCSPRMSYGHLGFIINVQPQSSKFKVEEVDRRIDGFLEFFREFLQKMSGVDFRNQIEAAITAKLRPPSNLLERSNLIFDEIVTHGYVFDRRQQEAAMLETVTKEELLGWFMAGIHPASTTRRKIAVWVVGSGERSDWFNDLRFNEEGDGDTAASSDSGAVGERISATSEPHGFEMIDGEEAEGGEDSGGGHGDKAKDKHHIPVFANYSIPVPIVSAEAYLKTSTTLPSLQDALLNVDQSSA
jgi:hypothetical protein